MIFFIEQFSFGDYFPRVYGGSFISKNYFMTDNDKMPFGKYKNEKMINVPADYLLWLYENANVFGDVKQYIKENLETIKSEIKLKKKSG